MWDNTFVIKYFIFHFIFSSSLRLQTSFLIFLYEFVRPVSQADFYLPKELYSLKIFYFRSNLIWTWTNFQAIIWNVCWNDKPYLILTSKNKIICRSRCILNYPLIIRYANLIIIWYLRTSFSTDNLELSTSCEFFHCVWATHFSVVAYCADHASCCGYKVFKANIFSIYLSSALKTMLDAIRKRK